MYYNWTVTYLDYNGNLCKIEISADLYNLGSAVANHVQPGGIISISKSAT